MLSVDRQRRLLQHLRARGPGNVPALAEALGVSESTVRRDLRDMDERGLLTRVHGGASLTDSEVEPVASTRIFEHSDEKHRIGAAAAELIRDGSTVLITGGTTTTAMLGNLAGRTNLTVLTNALDVAYQLGRFPEISVVVLGGVLRHEEMSLLGPIAEHVLEEFHVDQAFCSAFAIDAEVGLSAANVTEAVTDRRILQRAGQLIVLADFSKFDRRGPVRVADVDQITYLITDTAAPTRVLDAMRANGVRTIVC